MRKLLIYLKDYKKETVFAPLFKMLEATFELFVPLVVAAMIDRGIGTGNTGFVLTRGLLLVGLGLIGLVCSVTAQYFAAKAAAGFAAQMKHALFAHLQRLSFSDMDQIGTSTMITRMTSDANQAQNAVNMALRLFLRSPFIVLGAMVMSFTINLKAALIFVVAIPVLSIVVFGIMAITMPMYRRAQAGLDRILGRTRENLTGVRVLRAFHKEEEETAAFAEENENLTGLQLFVGKISALTNPVTYVLINAAVIVLIYVGALQVNVGVLTQGEVVALVNYMSQILVELIKLANLIVTVTRGLACANRIAAVFEIQPGMEWQYDAEIQTDAGSRATIDGQVPVTEHESDRAVTSGNDSDMAVQFDHVSLVYPGAGGEALSDIDLTVRRGETIGIIGGTGSGKSSLVNLMPRFYDVTGGCVKVDGRDVRTYGKNELRGKIGMVLQQAELFQGTIRSNLCWGDETADDEALWQALRISQSAEFVRELDEGLDAPVAQGGRNFSGGQRQRLTIARALVKQPQILVLDDSASALDYATDKKLRQALAALAGQMTTFIVSQRTGSLLTADRILVLEDGRMVGLGTHTELLERCPVYREIYESQV